MAKQQTATETKSEGVNSAEQLEDMRRFYEQQLNAIMAALVDGAGVSEIKKGDPSYTDALGTAIELRAKLTETERLNSALINYGQQLDAVMGALVGGEDVSGIKKGEPAYSDALDAARDLRTKLTATERLNGDLIKKLDALARENSRAGQTLRAELGFIILPDGQRINTRVIASYHATGIGEIEFKTSDGKTLGVYSAPLNNEQGSILPARRKEIRDQVIAQLDKLVDAMD